MAIYKYRATDLSRVIDTGVVDRRSLRPIELEAIEFLLPLSTDYPGIDQWFCRKVVPGLRAETRYLLRVERGGELIGLGIAKREISERKICTVRVAPHYFGRGVGVRIFDGLLKWIGEDRPHLTVSERRLPAFERIFDSFGFNLTSVQQGRYLPHATEMGYNEAKSGCEERLFHPQVSEEVVK
jgi:hypothetical protein